MNGFGMTETTTGATVLPWHQPQWSYIRGRMDSGRLPHALLFTGPEGLGKRRLAGLVAMRWLCDERRGGEAPCGVCRSCELVARDSHPDALSLTPAEGKTDIRIDPMRQLIRRLQLTGDAGRRVAMVHPADAMNRASANAFLKTLEEPAAGCLLLLVSARPHRLPVTVASRCQRIALAPPPRADALAWLRDHAPEPGESLEEALMLAGGAPLRARALAGEEARRRRQGMLETLEALSRGEVSPGQTAASWSRETPADNLEVFSRWLLQALRPEEGPRSPLYGPIRACEPGAVLEFVRRLDRARADLDSQLRTDLVIEDLLLQWLNLNTAGGRRNA